MLDTIVLTLPEHQFRILHSERFSPDSGFLTNPMYGGKTLMKAVYNPTKAESYSSYKPRLTLVKRPFTDRIKAISLKIEFSAPKLLFGNNFVELRGSDDFEYVLGALHSALKQMGIDVALCILRTAQVTAIHYSKNILLERNTPAFLLITELQKLDVSTKLDLNQTDFRNGGQMVKYHASTYEVALYDKVKDLEQASKYGDARSAETDSACQMDFLDIPKLPEVLRFEVRLKSKKLKPLMKKVGMFFPLEFESLFNVGLSRTILLHFWNQITEGLYLLNLTADDPASLVTRIRASYPRKRPSTMMQLVGFAHIADKMGIRAAKSLLKLSNPTFYKLKKDLQNLDAKHTMPRFSVLKAVKEQIIEFIPVVADDIVKTDLLKKMM